MKTTRLSVLAAGLGLIALPAAAADSYAIDKAHSEIGFQVVHLGLSKVRGQFKEFDAKILVDPARPDTASVELTIQATSIDTGNESRDNDLRSGAGFFEVAQYPAITFKSSRITPKGKDVYDVAGTLTLRGVSKEVAFPIKLTGPIDDPWGNSRAALEAQTTLNRKDYGLTYHKILDTGGLVVSDEVTVSINLEVTSKKAAAAK